MIQNSSVSQDQQPEHRFSRTELVVGRKGVECLRSSHVVVFGLGGVGGYAVEALTRAGIGHLTLVDFDTFSTSNINRQLHALDATVGQNKVYVVGKRCLEINPQVELTQHLRRYSSESADVLLEPSYDYVVDCIDTISAKIDLIQQCSIRDLAIISSMGAANKLDPTQVLVADLFATEKCRLARIMRKELRKRGVESKVPVVYSREKYRPAANARPAQPRVSGEDWQQPPLGSISTIPPLFGIMMAGVVVQHLLGEV
ncbi:MAG: tRNA cyclic N6-threonylcarbamoyladenosine(37) synthase TcdA [Desulfobacteraceae bacterium 4572_35.1]|nr:MAG: tRNA cyclic N6-threonylcarbamoyladenosine(37) synthase TcdA [Desulfobacteraceae bacterium 4572_35.1]